MAAEGRTQAAASLKPRNDNYDQMALTQSHSSTPQHMRETRTSRIEMSADLESAFEVVGRAREPAQDDLVDCKEQFVV